MQKTDKKEEILLDAMISDVISCRAFYAELENGHRFVAYGNPEGGRERGIGDNITVIFSPYDMSKGRISQRESEV